MNEKMHRLNLKSISTRLHFSTTSNLSRAYIDKFHYLPGCPGSQHESCSVVQWACHTTRQKITCAQQWPALPQYVTCRSMGEGGGTGKDHERFKWGTGQAGGRSGSISTAVIHSPSCQPPHYIVSPFQGPGTELHPPQPTEER